MFLIARIFLIIGIFGLFQHLVAMRCHSMIRAWAKQGGWRALKTHRKFINLGPFKFNPGLPVYRVTLENACGKQRHAYVRCGHELISVLSDEMAVEWIAASPEIARD